MLSVNPMIQQESQQYFANNYQEFMQQPILKQQNSNSNLRYSQSNQQPNILYSSQQSSLQNIHASQQQYSVSQSSSFPRQSIGDGMSISNSNNLNNCSQFVVPHFQANELEMYPPNNNNNNNNPGAFVMQQKAMEDKISEIVEKCMNQYKAQQEGQNNQNIQNRQNPYDYNDHPVNQKIDFQQREALISLGLNSERSSFEYQELKDATGELNRKVKELQKTIDDMHMSITEKEAEVIRLNLCLGDEKKRNQDLNQVVSSLNINESTPQRKSSQTTFHGHHGSNYGSGAIRNGIDSPYFYKQQSTHQRTPSKLSQSEQIQVQKQSAETQTDFQMVPSIDQTVLKQKLKRYEDMLKSESEANEEMTERVQELEKDVYSLKQEKDKAFKNCKSMIEEKETVEFRVNELEGKLQSKEDHINTLKNQLEKINKENIKLQRQLEAQQSCGTCIEYIKKVKSIEFKINDLLKDRETSIVQITELKKQSDQKEDEIVQLKDKLIDLEDEHKDRVGYNMSFSEREFEYMKELDKQKKKNEINEMIINQLKRQLEKCAYQLIQLQERGIIKNIGSNADDSDRKNPICNDMGERDRSYYEDKDLERTMSASQDDRGDWI